MKHFYTFFLSLIITGLIWAKKPNFVFLVSEDNSIHYLKHYGAKFGSMPNVEKMATEGVTFNHAFNITGKRN
jgi:arylsulfatase A-like enzyme